MLSIFRVEDTISSSGTTFKPLVQVSFSKIWTLKFLFIDKSKVPYIF